MQTQQITLTGFLGADPRILETRERIVEREAYNYLAGAVVPQDFLIPSRPFARISLATHEGGRTTWHNIVAWNMDQGRRHFGVRIASKGDQVRVKAHWEERRWTDEQGTEHQVRQLVLDDLGFLRKKVRPELQTV